MRDGLVALPADHDHVTAELGRERLGHDADPRAKTVSSQGQSQLKPVQSLPHQSGAGVMHQLAHIQTVEHPEVVPGAVVGFRQEGLLTSPHRV